MTDARSERYWSELSASRPSETNPSAPHSGDETAADRLDLHTKWWKQKNERVDEFVEGMGSRAIRPVSVRESQKLREECARASQAGDGWKSRPWSAVLNEFLNWYNGYRHAHLRFRSPDGDLVRAPMENSHQPVYGNRYYAKLKAFERRAIEEFDDLHVVMLTLTGSTRNANGGWRCPADHLRDVVDPFGSNVRPALHRALGDKRWEYCKVLEHHKSGYGHMHVAVFVDGEVSESDFHKAIDAHLRHCEIAGREAHDYHAPSVEARPISVSAVDPNLHLEDTNKADMEAIGNLGSYVAEYIGSHGEELLDRGIEELAFRSVCWATGTQRVTFSPGASDLIAEDLDADDEQLLDDAPDRWKPGVTGEDIEAAAKDPETQVSDLLEGEGNWSLDGIGRIDRDGESVHEIRNTSVSWVHPSDASHLDPPNPQPFQRPRRRTSQAELG